MDIERSFFGRQEILGLLKKRALDLKDGYRQNIAFLGPQYIGKTSILQRFITDLDDKDFITVYINFERKDFQYFFANFIGTVLYNFAKSQGLEPHQEVDLLLETVKGRLPLTVAAVKHVQLLAEKKRFADAYQELIALLEVFSQEADKFCVIIFDEFHHLEEFDIPEAFQELGKRIMTQKRCLYLMASSLHQVARKILSEKLSLLFGHFEIIDIEPFTLKVSQEFIACNLGTIQMKDQLKNFLVDFTGGHPFYLNMLLGELVQLCQVHRQGEVFLPFLSLAVENTIFSRWGILSRHFEILTESLAYPKDAQGTARLLIALSEQKNNIADIIPAAELKKTAVKQKIAKLIELDLVDRSGNFYYLKDKMFRYWIKYVLKRRLHLIGLDPQKERAMFREEFAKAVSDFQLASQKDMPSRITELLTCFGDDAFSFHGRRYSLPSFKKFKSSKVRVGPDHELDVIKAYSPEGPWLVVLNDQNLSENDVSVLLSEVKKAGQRPSKKVIVSLKSLESPVRLKALQEKMWIWNEGELNFLFNMYNKPYIVK